MSSEERKCTKCGGLMEGGFLHDKGRVGETFVTGPEQIGWMAGDDLQYRTGWFGNTVTNQHHKVTASRCTSCGFLEMYAG
jgi:hypothetical protein